MESKDLVREFEEILNVDPGSLAPEDSFQELEGWDSFAALSLITLIDESYGLTLEGTEIIQCPTLADLVRLVEKQAPAS